MASAAAAPALLTVRRHPYTRCPPLPLCSSVSTVAPALLAIRRCPVRSLLCSCAIAPALLLHRPALLLFCCSSVEGLKLYCSAPDLLRCSRLQALMCCTAMLKCSSIQGFKLYFQNKVYSLDWTPEKNWIVSTSQDGRLIVWNALTSQKTHAIKLHCPWVMTCAFAPNGQSVACGGLDSACSIFNLNSQVDRDGNLPVSRVLTGHKGYVSSCQYVPDQETHLITSSGDKTCVLWDVTTGQRISIFGGEFPSGHTADVLSVSINSSNTNMFVSGSCDATVRLWDIRIASRAVRTYHGHEGDINSVKFFPDGHRFGTGSDDGTCRLFDMRTGHQLQVYSMELDRNDNELPTVTSIAFSISGRLLFAGYSNGDCYVWDTLLAEVVLNLGNLQNSHDGRISCLGMSSDGSALCTGSWDKNLKIWAFSGHRKIV